MMEEGRRQNEGEERAAGPGPRPLILLIGPQGPKTRDPAAPCALAWVLCAGQCSHPMTMWAPASC